KPPRKTVLHLTEKPSRKTVLHLTEKTVAGREDSDDGVGRRVDGDGRREGGQRRRSGEAGRRRRSQGGRTATAEWGGGSTETIAGREDSDGGVGRRVDGAMVGGEIEGFDEEKKKNADDELVVFQILSRLPVKSLMRFNCVCKGWKSIIGKDLHFINLHYTNSEARPDMQCQHRRGYTMDQVNGTIKEYCVSVCGNGGSVYWFTSKGIAPWYDSDPDPEDEYSETLIAFDIGSEQFRIIPIPIFTRPAHLDGLCRYHLIEMDGCPTVLRHYMEFDIWIIVGSDRGTWTWTLSNLAQLGKYSISFCRHLFVMMPSLEAADGLGQQQQDNLQAVVQQQREGSRLLVVAVVAGMVAAVVVVADMVAAVVVVDILNREEVDKPDPAVDILNLEEAGKPDPVADMLQDKLS
ncbi:hypothetical protein LINPERPRIM_LOCUS11603, partial [Linum perenne]